MGGKSGLEHPGGTGPSGGRLGGQGPVERWAEVETERANWLTSKQR
jgi:hypothetical protein